MGEISKDELALYDRQIRLWGLEAQKKLREGSVLIISYNMNNVVQEICKNLALCGISALSIRLLSNDSFKNLLYVSLEEELTEIHPKILFSCTFSEVEAMISFDEFDFIIACGHHEIIQYSYINKIARASGKFNLLCFQYEGKCYIFNDFGEFSVNSSNSDKMYSFPSFEDAVNRHITLNAINNNSFQELFIKATQSLKNSTFQTEVPLEIAGSAILGALVSQEVIKGFSKTDIPFYNLMVSDLKTLKNTITTIGIIS